MTDKLANAKAFHKETGNIARGKTKWEPANGARAQADAIRYLQLKLDYAIRADDPNYGGGDPTEAVTDTNVKAFAKELYNAGVVVRRWAPNAGLAPEQIVVFGEPRDYPGPNVGYAGDLVKAIQLDDPTWKP